MIAYARVCVLVYFIWRTIFYRYDINGGAIGIAYLSRVCTTGGVSITENDFTTGTGVVAAHELGHR